MRWFVIATSLVLGAAGCGAPNESPIASLGLSLDAQTASRISELQVELVQSSSVDCGQLQSACFASQGLTPVPFAGDEAGHKVYRAPFTTADSGAPIDLEVTPGTYAVNVEALDAAGHLVANACDLAVTFASSQTVDVNLILASYDGPDCDAAM